MGGYRQSRRDDRSMAGRYPTFIGTDGYRDASRRSHRTCLAGRPPQRPGTTSRRTAPRPWHADVIAGARRRSARTPAMTSNTTRIGIMRAITAHAITREATITSTIDMSYHLGLTPRAIIDAAVEALREAGHE